MTDRPPPTPPGVPSSRLLSEGLALAIAKATGKPTPNVSAEARNIFADVQANLDALKACDGHAFEPMEPSRPLGRKYKCAACGGIVDAIWRAAYKLGAEHERARAERARGG